MVDIREPDPRFRQTIGNGVLGIPAVVFLAGEALFLSGGEDATVFDQRCCAVVVERRDSENAHPVLPSVQGRRV